jgi:glycosyltransferase involved in cell wall biosynthesis
MSSDSISVVIPTYNSSSTIVRALESVISQTLLPSEAIIIDDCSLDDTVQKILAWKNGNPGFNVLLIQNDKNRGPSFSRNIGIKASKSCWIAFLDSDDFWHPQKTELQLRTALDFDFKFSGTISVSARKTLQTSIENFKHKRLYPKNFLWKNHFQTPTVLIYKTEDLFFDETMRFAEDYDLWRRMIEKYGSAGLILSPLTSLGKSPYLGSGLSSNLIEMEKGELRILWKEKNLILRMLSILFSLVKFLRRTLVRRIKAF